MIISIHQYGQVPTLLDFSICLLLPLPAATFDRSVPGFVLLRFILRQSIYYYA